MVTISPNRSEARKARLKGQWEPDFQNEYTCGSSNCFGLVMCRRKDRVNWSKIWICFLMPIVNKMSKEGWEKKHKIIQGRKILLPDLRIGAPWSLDG